MVLAALWLIPFSPVISLLLFLCSFAVRAPARAARLLGGGWPLWWLWLGGVGLSAAFATRFDVSGPGALACLAFVGVIAAVSRAMPGDVGVRKGMAALFWGTVPWALVGIAFALTATHWIGSWGSVQIRLGTWDNRANSVFGHPNQLAGYLVLAIAASLPFWNRRLRFGAGIVALAVCQILTQSRAGLLGTGIVLASAFCLSRLPALRASSPVRPAAPRWRAAWPWVAGAALAAAAMPPVLRRLGDLLDPSSQSTLGRLFAWTAAWQMIAARPLLGWGPGGWSLAYPAFRDPAEQEGLVHAHSLLLHLAAEIGLVPTSLLVAAVVATPVAALRAVAGDAARLRLGVALSAGLIGYFALGLFDVVATEGRNALGFGAVLGLLAGLARAEGGRVVDV